MKDVSGQLHVQGIKEKTTDTALSDRNYYKMMTWILIKRLVESIHVTRHLFCLMCNLDNDRSLFNSNDRSLVKSCYKTNKT